MRNQHITRARLAELCREFGHDPERVARIVVEPRRVKFEYVHPVIPDQETPSE